ncbi:VOC family protein [Pseudonocardia lutea]|uniref:VOC family protein n=1 Tax=Pseudonocardia lutea TaxID=2172015 RepID=A0ABW1I3R9_9PSEU
MNFASIRIITAQLPRLVAFYEDVTGLPADWATPQFAELRTPAGTLALADTTTVSLFGPGSAEPAANRSAIIEFLVDDVDATYARLADHLDDIVTPPTTMPWGNRALLFRDPDGNLVNLFTPVTEAARARQQAPLGRDHGQGGGEARHGQVGATQPLSGRRAGQQPDRAVSEVGEDGAGRAVVGGAPRVRGERADGAEIRSP